MTNVGGTLVSIDHVSKTFPGQRALTDVSFDISHGEIHALVGENGSGKSTLIKVLAGYHAADPGGRVLVDGELLRPNAPAEVRRLGLRFVHQNLGLVAELSAAENMGLTAGFATRGPKIDWREQRVRASSLLSRIGVGLDVDMPVANLRAVERSAIAIARALDEMHGRIRLLVLDEPTAALPPTETEALLTILHEIRAQGVSILYVSHRLDEILGLADRVTVLRDSRYMGTFDANGMERARLAELIVGQEVSADASRSHRTFATGERVIDVSGLRTSLLRGVDFSLNRGEVVGFAGLSGSGREDLAAALTGKIDAELELIDTHGRTWHRMTPSRAMQLGIALVLANRDPAAAIDQFTVSENVSIADLSKYTSGGRVNRAKERSAMNRWIDKLRVSPRDPSRMYSSLSGGNKQKVILAKWLSIDPSVIVMDDPTSGVDIGARHGIYQLIRDQAALGAGVVVCSSDFEDLLGLCDRVLVLVDGVVVGQIDAEGMSETRLLASVTGSGRPQAPGSDAELPEGSL